MTFRLASLLALVLLQWLPGTLPAQSDPVQSAAVFERIQKLCFNWQSEPVFEYLRSESIEFRGRAVGTRFFLEAGAAAIIELEAIGRPESPQSPERFIAVLIDDRDRPRLLIALDGSCGFQLGRQLVYGSGLAPTGIVELDRHMAIQGNVEQLDAPWEKPEKRMVDSDALRVGMVDSGVNYQLSEINQGLAQDSQGRMIGYDFWDMDALPFDAHPGRSPFFVQRHGTKTASILLREAPGIALVPYRYPRPDMSRMRDLVEHAVRNRVRVLGMPLGGTRSSEWQSFAEVARENPDLLFIASAGNNGVDIDQQPVFPAALELDNLLVVTSSDDFVRPADRSNWGQIAVDYLLPAENINALNFNGQETRVSGSSYAVARMVALAARLLQENPTWTAKEVVNELERRYQDVAPDTRRWVRTGYIPDPRVDRPLQFSETLQRLELGGVTALGLSLDVLVLDDRWSPESVRKVIRQSFDILAQCDIGPLQGIVRRLEVAPYLRDLSVGNAHTLFSTLPANGLRVVFARDTAMQEQYTGEAFGIGNTAMRPWMTNSVWLMLDVDDPGVALAHEIYHVLANDGTHTRVKGNLMQGRTRPDGTTLSVEQCQVATEAALQNRLLVNL